MSTLLPEKTLVCRCEDVTLGEVQHAVGLGHTDIEEVKRFTGLGTGTCGGKECMSLCARVLALATGRAPELAQPFTARPPLHTVMLGTLAALAEPSDEEPGSRGAREPVHE